MMTVNDVINERAMREKTSFDVAAERYFFDALEIVKKKGGCVNTRSMDCVKSSYSAQNFKCRVCKHPMRAK